MPKIQLDNVDMSVNLSTINANFQKIEQELQEKVLYRDNPTGEPNTLQTDIDANGRSIYNVGTLLVQDDIKVDGVSLYSSVKAFAEEVEDNAEQVEIKTQEAINAATVASNAAIAAADSAASASAHDHGELYAESLALADDDGASLIGYGSRTVEQALNDVVNVRKYITTAIDGVTSNQAGIVAAVAAAYASDSELFWPAGTYVSTDTIPNFHDVVHTGSKAIVKRGTDIFYITPKGTELNILYTGFGGSALNDGLTKDQPMTVAAVRDVLQELGSKASKGIWRVQFVAGTCTENGATFYNLPYFANPLEIRGLRDGSNNALATWDGATSTAMYAIRADGHSQGLHIDVRDMKFINWDGDASNAGALVLWEGSNVLTENNDYEACTIAVWCRGGYSRHYRERINNCVWGISTNYNHTLTMGTAVKRNTITNCDIGVFLARESAGHVDYTDFSGNINDIQLHQKSRVATIGTTFTGWTDVSVWLQGDSIHENVDSTWDGASITDATPVYRFSNGSSEPSIHWGPLPYRAEHYCPNSGYTLTGTTSPVILSEQAGFGSPLRLPKFLFYNNATLQVKIEARIDTGGSAASRRISLNGPGPAYELGFIDIPAGGGGGLGKLTIEVTFRANGTAIMFMKYESSNTAQNVVKWVSISAATISNIRNKTSESAGWRLYGTLTNAADSLSIFSLTTTITG